MGVSRLRAAMVTCAVGVSLALGMPGVGLAESPGMVKASHRTVKEVIADIGLSVPPRCIAAKQTRSDRAWGTYTLKYRSGCPTSEGYTVIHRSGGSWRALPLGGSSVPCSYLKQGLSKADAPSSVFRDLKAAGACDAGQ